MSLLSDRDATALLVVDMQRDVVADAWRRDEVVTAIADLVERARVGGVPVVWIQHHEEGLERGTAGWQLIDELGPEQGEARIDKAFGDAFAATPLHDVLGSLGVDHVVVVGAQSDYCVRSTFFGALYRGYDATLVADAHTTVDDHMDAEPLSAPTLVTTINKLAWTTRLPGVEARLQSASEIELARDTSDDELLRDAEDDDASDDDVPDDELHELIERGLREQSA